jgi:hypothetical protein
MPRSKGRASRSESGTWRRGSGEDEKEGSEGENVLKTRAPSVPSLRSTRGRRSKAEPSFAIAAEGVDEALAGETQAASFGELARLLKMAGAVTTLLCLLYLLLYRVGYCAEPAEIYDGALLRDMLGDNSPHRCDGLYSWVNKMPWRKECSEPVTVETHDHVQGLRDSGPLRDNTAWICPQCPRCSACVDKIVYITNQTDGTRKVTSPVKVPLPPSLSRFEVFSQFMQQEFDVCYEAVVYHPWAFLLMVLCAAWKAAELVLRLARLGGAYALFAGRMVKMYMGNDKIGWVNLDDESEKARKDAEEKLLLRMTTAGNED